MDANELYLGIDIDEKYSQISYYDLATKSVKTVLSKDKNEVFENNLSLTDIFSKNHQNPVDAISRMLGALISAAKGAAATNIIGSISLCLHKYTPKMRAVFEKALLQQGIKKEQYILIGEEEAFAYYAFSGDKALTTTGTCFYNLTERGLKYTMLSKVNYKGALILRELSQVKVSDKIKKVASGEVSIIEAKEEILSFFEETRHDQRLSSVYLTGRGFCSETLQADFTTALTGKGVRIFIGNNLFVKGACICAMTRLVPMADPFVRAGHFKKPAVAAKRKSSLRTNKSLMACKNRITSAINLKVLNHDKEGKIPLIVPGCNIDDAAIEFECILVDTDYLQLEVVPYGAAPRIETIKLEPFAKASPKTVRVKVSFYFIDEDKLKVKVKECPFVEDVKFNQAEVDVAINLTARDPDPMDKIKTRGVIYCSNERAVNPYIFEDTGKNIYTIEELVYYLYNNVYLIKKAFVNNDLFAFLREEVKANNVADRLEAIVSENGTLKQIMMVLFEEVNYYNANEIKIIEPIIESVETADPSLRKYSIATAYLKNNCLVNALKLFQELKDKPIDDSLPISFFCKVDHNLGVCFARLSMYDFAAEAFSDAYALANSEESRKAAIFASYMAGIKPKVSYSNKELEDCKLYIDELGKHSKEDLEYEGLTLSERLEKEKEDYRIAHSF